jgi:hypothetical protein
MAACRQICSLLVCCSILAFCCHIDLLHFIAEIEHSKITCYIRGIVCSTKLLDLGVIPQVPYVVNNFVTRLFLAVKHQAVDDEKTHNDCSF